LGGYLEIGGQAAPGIITGKNRTIFGDSGSHGEGDGCTRKRKKVKELSFSLGVKKK